MLYAWMVRGALSHFMVEQSTQLAIVLFNLSFNFSIYSFSFH